MIVIDIEDFSIEIKNGVIKNVGGPQKSASVKFFDVENTEVRRFGKDQIKLCFEDEEGNRVEIAISEGEGDKIRQKIKSLL
ncbi:MAG: hypothetical protein ACJ0QU_01670 [Halobacteriales archaeon]|tara:strand:+ start:1092 stop:1334 length:243 start_codon:yes stop_codon:yes gene_type:complete